MSRTLTLQPYADIHSFIGDGEVVAFDVGADGHPYVVIACKELDYRETNEAGASFAKVTPDSPQVYRVLRIDDGEATLDLRIEDVALNVHHVQPLPEGILLACARSHLYKNGDFDQNARVYDWKGRHQRSLLLGDGIQSVQATASGTIWTSYCDAGVSGNYGWDKPIGASGLVAWSSTGEREYEFEPPEGLDAIADCHALNVESDAVTWCYYYTEFALVRIRNRVVEEHWKIPIEGARAFSILGEFAVFSGGRDHPDQYSFFRVAPNRDPQLRGEFTVELHEATAAARAVGRGGAIWFLAKDLLYRMRIDEARDALE